MDLSAGARNKDPGIRNKDSQPRVSQQLLYNMRFQTFINKVTNIFSLDFSTSLIMHLVFLF